MRLIEGVTEFPFVFDCTRVPDLRGDVSQRALAMEIGVSPQQLSRWENGSARPPVDVCLALIAKYGAGKCMNVQALWVMQTPGDEMRADIDAACQRTLGDRG